MRAAGAQWRSRARGAHAMSYDGPLQLLVMRQAQHVHSYSLSGKVKRRERHFSAPACGQSIGSGALNETATGPLRCTNRRSS
jgi:hypothetical protein